MSEKTFGSVLETLQNNQTLTALDLSMNGLGNSAFTKGAIRTFLKHNKALRVLDLCNNKFTTETTKEIYLGLLENSSILLLPLAGNIGLSQSSEMSLIQEQLLDNRLRYKRIVDALTYVAPPEPVQATAVSVSTGTALDRDVSGSADHRLAVAIPIDQYYDNDNLSLKQHRDDKGNSTSAGNSPVTSDEDSSVGSKGNDVANGSTKESNALSRNTVECCTHDEHHPHMMGKRNLKVFFSAPLAWRDRTNTLHPLEVLDYASERNALIQVFRDVNRDLSVCFDFATTDSLRTALSFGCRAIHFSGHGHPNCLNFEDGRSGLQLVNVETLTSLLKAGGLKLDFVFVSACHSRVTAAAFVEAGVPHVVCVKVEAMILDSAAMAFTRAFYLALLSGKTVKISFDIAREALKASPYVPDSVLEGEKFVLLPDHENANHDVPIFVSNPIVDWPGPGHLRKGPSCSNIIDDDSMSSPSDDNDNDNSSWQCWPSAPPDFEGREVDMYRVITTLSSRRLVTLIGELGVGKSSLASAVCTYVSDRAMFGHGVVYVRAIGIKKYPDFLSSGILVPSILILIPILILIILSFQ